ncbi:hypothetical protein BDZ89DRAFT_1120431 [Hymenopellis radicata]|nr:hypothetical protein BDZ89DRAFT_1120431 [Hymenopellis radicata]
MSTASKRSRRAPEEYCHVFSSGNNDNESSRAVPSQPSRKRGVKTKHQSIAKSKKTQESRMDALGRLPVELIHEILLHLMPKSLLAIMPLCRRFYDILSNTSVTSVALWKAAWSNERVPIPAPPPDFSELQWAKFLWTNYCEICGPKASKKLTILYAVRKRICVKCVSANLVHCGASTSALLKKIPFASGALLPLLVPSDKDKSGSRRLLMTAWSRDWDTDNHIIEANRKYYWIPDITSMFRQVSMDHPEVFFGCAGAASASAKREYEVFVKERTEHIQRRLQHAYECCEWERKTYLLERQDADDSRIGVSIAWLR